MKIRTASSAATPSPSPTAAEVLAALDRRLAALGELDRRAVAEQIELERTGAIPTEPSTVPNVQRRAHLLLNGEGPSDMVGLPNGERLFAIIHERAAIAVAIGIGGHERIRAEIGRAAEVIAEHRGRWADIVRKRVAALLALRAANREAEAFKAEMNELARVGLDWPADPYLGWIFSSDFDRDDPVSGFLETAIAGGFVTAKEVR